MRFFRRCFEKSQPMSQITSRHAALRRLKIPVPIRLVASTTILYEDIAEMCGVHSEMPSQDRVDSSRQRVYDRIDRAIGYCELWKRRASWNVPNVVPSGCNRLSAVGLSLTKCEGERCILEWGVAESSASVSVDHSRTKPPQI